MSDEERRFTLDEARRELALRECSRSGHLWDVATVRRMCDKFDIPIRVMCTRCQESHVVERKTSA